MKHILWILLALSSSAMIVACSKGSDNTVAPIDANMGCPSGSTFRSNGLCYNAYNQVVNTNATSFNSENYQQRTANVSNSNVYGMFLREVLAICDRDGYNSGISSCSNYQSGYFRLTLQAPNPSSNAARLTVEVGPANVSNYWYNVSLPTGGQLASCLATSFIFGNCMTYATANQMQIGSPIKAFDMTVSLINNSQGFEGRSYGAAGTFSANSLIQFIVPSGKMQDGYFDYQLAYKGQSAGVFMTGRMIRCSDTTCGMTAWGY